MDFLVGLPVTPLRHNCIMVVVDKLTKSAHFIPVKSTFNAPTIAQVFLKEIVRLHGVPWKIISDRDVRFTSIFWQSIHEALGTQLNFSTAYHPETDGQIEKVNQVMEDMLRMYVMDQQKQWERYLTLVEFAYNNSYHNSLDVAPHEALYGRPCRTPLSWDCLEDRVTIGPDLIQEMEEKMSIIKQRLKEAHDRKKSYVDAKQLDRNYEVGNMVFIRVRPKRAPLCLAKQ